MTSRANKFIAMLCLCSLGLANGASLPMLAASAASPKSDVLLPPMAPKLDTRGMDNGGKSNQSWSSGQSDAGVHYTPYNADSANNSGANYGSSDSDSDKTKVALQNATTLYSQGRTAEAETAFKHVIALDSRNSEAYYNLGVIAESRNDLAAAAKNYQKAAQLSPSDRDFAEAAASVATKLSQQSNLANRDREQQKQAASLAQADKDQEQLKGMVADSQTAFKAGNFTKAINGLQTVASRAPNDPDVQYALAQAYRGAGNTSGARTALNRALTIDPNNQLYLVALSELNKSSVPSIGGAGGADQYNHNQPSVASQHGYGQLPAPAQSYGSGGQSSYGSQSAYSGGTGYSSASPYNGNYSDPNGGVQPFTQAGEAKLSQSRNSQNGYANYGYGGYGGGVTSSARMKRAAIGAAGGMAVGMMFGGMSHRGMGRSAMTGAMIGGMMGMLSGGSRY